MSSAMVVIVDAPALGLKGRVFLKLYDRRFATSLRSDYKVSPWSPEIERQYRKFVLDGSASKFLPLLQHEREDSDEDEEEEEEVRRWSPAQDEINLWDCCCDYYNIETEVYERVKDLQGKDVPRLMAYVSLSPCPSSYNNLFGCPGILLEFIDGFSLADLKDHAPKDTWQSICDDAIRVVNLIGDRDLRNDDVHPRNAIVRRDATIDKFKVFIIDFGHCVLRKPDNDELDWRHDKAWIDEEDAIGGEMRHILRNDEGFVFHRTPKYQQLIEDFRGEHSYYEELWQRREEARAKAKKQAMHAMMQFTLAPLILEPGKNYCYGPRQKERWESVLDIWLAD